MGYDNGTLYVKTVEHRGPKGGYTYSTMFNTMFSNHWRECNTMRVYDVANTTAMYNAGKYAYNNLTGKTYNFIASKGADEVNCATLVYKAYRSQGILLENPASATVIPKDIVNDSDVILRANSEWAGGEHTW